MLRHIGLFGLLLAFAFVVGGVRGGETKKVDIDALFKKLDANADGKLNKDEFLKAGDLAKNKSDAVDKLKKVYDKLDPKGAGLSLDQFKKFLEARKKTKE